MNRICLLSIVAGALVWGCRSEPAPPRVPVPTTDQRTRQHEPIRPVSQPEGPQARFFFDPPLVHEPPPEQAAYVASYQQVGAPRITVFVNRTLQGDIVPVRPHEPVYRFEHERRAAGDIAVEDRETYIRRDRWTDQRHERIDRFEAAGPGQFREVREVYLRPGEYDEIHARALDYQAMESIITDWLAANGQIELVSPMMARGRLSDEQIAELEAGRPRMLSELARELDADVLVQVQARPTRQTREGLEVRVIAEAISLPGGQSIGRATMDIPPPLDRPQLAHYTRLLARKLMDDMAATWFTFAPPPVEQ